MHKRTMDIREASQQLAFLMESLDAGDQVILTDGRARLGCIIGAGKKLSLRDIEPASVGTLLRPYPGAGDDLLGEMLDQ